MKQTNGRTSRRFKQLLYGGTGALAAMAAAGTAGAQTNAPAQPSDALLNLMIRKGLVTEDEARQVKAEAAASATNMPTMSASKWIFSDAVKDIQLFGDIRFRYEYRAADSPSIGGVVLDRYRYAIRFGVRGDIKDNFYYALRLDTAANARSPWVTFGTASSASAPFQGPFGKSSAGLNIGQAFIGWRPESWVDVTVGKMANPLYTTSMLWDTDINPEGLAEHFKTTLSSVDLWANFGQFVYQDTNPNSAAGGLFQNFPSGQSTQDAFLLAWQGGFTYHADDDISFKAGATLYNYTGHGADIPSSPTAVSTTPGFSDVFVGEGSPFDAGGLKRPGSNSGPPGNNGNNTDGFFYNQTGINDLLVLDFPFQLDMKIKQFNTRLFGDYAQNLDGSARAHNAVIAAANTFGGSAFTAQPNDDKAYQVGVAVGNGELGLVYGSGPAKKGTWEARAFWQHVEQYALDPNLIDSDFFEGRGNLEGVYAAVAYCFADNMIGTLRWGYANRINKNLGTGGSNQDIPQVNPIEVYHLIQLDLTYKF